MEVGVGSKVRSKAGRDNGNDFLVLKLEGEYVYLADGKTRKVANPKKKKLKHIQPNAANSLFIKQKIEEQGSVSDAEVRKALAEI